MQIDGAIHSSDLHITLRTTLFVQISELLFSFRTDKLLFMVCGNTAAIYISHKIIIETGIFLGFGLPFISQHLLNRPILVFSNCAGKFFIQLVLCAAAVEKTGVYRGL